MANTIELVLYAEWYTLFFSCQTLMARDGQDHNDSERVRDFWIRVAEGEYPAEHNNPWRDADYVR